MHVEIKLDDGSIWKIPHKGMKQLCLMFLSWHNQQKREQEEPTLREQSSSNSNERLAIEAIEL